MKLKFTKIETYQISETGSYPDCFILQNKRDKAKNVANSKVLLIFYCEAYLLPWSNNSGQMPSIQDRNVWTLLEFLVKLGGEVLNERVLNIFDKIGCSISPDYIKSRHRISKKQYSFFFFFFQKNHIVVNLTQQKDSQ